MKLKQMVEHHEGCDILRAIERELAGHPVSRSRPERKTAVREAASLAGRARRACTVAWAPDAVR